MAPIAASPRRLLRAALAGAAVGIAAFAAAGPAAAGAWPREPGETFLSLRRDFERGDDGSGQAWALYGERGLSRRVTLGAQFSDHSAQWSLPRAGGFLRVALGDLTAPDRFSLSVGASTTPDALMAPENARLDVGVHWGRGFGSGLGPGWATWSYVLHFSHGDANPAHDLYGTIGIRPRSRWMVMLSGNRYVDSGHSWRKLTPAVGYEMRKDLWGVLQVSREFGNAETTAVGVGVWWSF